jgi:hypothetical protein
MALSSLETSTLDRSRVRPRERGHRLRAGLAGPIPVLIASSALAGAFLVALSDLVSRLG